MFSLNKTGPKLGVDINSETITLIQVEKTKRGIEFVRFAYQPSPINSVREGIIVDPEAVGYTLKEVIQSAGIKIARPLPLLNVAAPGQSVIIRLLPVPTGIPPEELADVVRQEALHHVPFPLEEASLDWSLLPASERTDVDGVQRVDVILAAIQKHIVDSFWHVSDIVGIPLNAISVSSLATIRALAFAGYGVQEDKLTMSVSIRHDGTDINFLKAGTPLFSRSVVLGVDTLTESIARSLDISIMEARGLCPHIPLLQTTSNDAALTQAAQIARTVLGDISDEIIRSIDFYRSQVGEVEISEMYVSGPGSVVPQVDRFLQTRLNVPATIIDPFQNLINSELIPMSQRAVYALPLGLLVEPAWSPVSTVDLDLNREGPSAALLEGLGPVAGISVVAEETTPWFMPVLAVGAAILIGVAGFWAYATQIDIPQKQAQIDRQQALFDTQKSQLKTLPEVKEATEQLERRKKILENIIKHTHPWSQTLETIRTDTPEGVQVRKIVLSQHNLRLEGHATDFKGVSHLAINIEGSRLAPVVEVESASREEKDPRIINFAITAAITPGNIIAHSAGLPVSGAPNALPNAATKPVRTSGKPQFLDFYATWCGPCNALKPHVEEAKRQFGDKIDFVSIDIDDPKNHALVEQYGVHAVPNMFFLGQQGQVLDHMVGFQGKDALMKAISRLSTVAQNGSSR